MFYLLRWIGIIIGFYGVHWFIQDVRGKHKYSKPYCVERRTKTGVITW